MSSIPTRGPRFSNRRVRAGALGLEESPTSLAADLATLSTGSGAPTHTAADGSIYLRNDGSAASTVYMRVASAWTAIGATAVSGTDFGSGGIATDVIAESTGAAGVTIDGLLLKDGSAVPGAVADPGNAGAISVAKSGVCQLVTAGAETRTIAAPGFRGQRLLLTMKTDGGDCVVTVATFVNQAGNNTITFNDAGDTLELVAGQSGNNIRWHVAFNDGAALSTV